MARPEPRELTLHPVVIPSLKEEAEKIAESITNSRVVISPPPENPADIVIASYDALDPSLPEGNAIVFMEHPLKQNRIVTGRLISDNHPIINHLNWEPLIVRRSLQIPRLEGDTVLLWQDERPLIMLREDSTQKKLLFNFDLKGSNALKLPAFILLIHRFAGPNSAAEARVRAENPGNGATSGSKHSAERGASSVSPRISILEWASTTLRVKFHRKMSPVKMRPFILAT